MLMKIQNHQEFQVSQFNTGVSNSFQFRGHFRQI